MSKSGTPADKRKKKKRRRKKKPADEAAVDAGPSTVKKAVRQGGGGVMQGLRNGFKRAAGQGEDTGEKPSTLSNILWTVVLLAALGFLLYRWYG